ncbi:MAG: bifunctional folylpolyglutamate synthase/dihydrofolate synthase [Lachnospiraceae bacterium]|nr:bifunctional folylpolyglutamate synthase/dihydrofolate synthase [Lachnospiraceae bacterium]
MSYEEVRRYLAGAEHTRGIRPGLSRMRQLMTLLGNPEKSIRGIIHVAGTNGKGSILAFLDEILRRAGYHVVKYTSPAVFSWLERYTADGQPVTEKNFAAAAGRVIAAAELISEREGDPPTAFEIETAAAYLIAAEAACDFFLVETGMGGLLDATNITDRVTLSVIGSVSRDHMAFLGNTLEEIAAQKAGIIKDGCPVVVSASNFRCENGNLIVKAAAVHRAAVYRGDDRVPYPLSLSGAHQQENAGAAYTAVRVLRQLGYGISESCVREGFAHTVWPGRFETVRQTPLCILDGAHNAAAAERLAETLRGPQYAEKKKFLVLGIFKDKEYDQVVRAVAPMAEKVYVFTPDSPRGLSAGMLAACVRSLTGRPVTECGDVGAAVGAAYREAEKNGENGMVLCCGSLSYLGKAKDILLTSEKSAVSCL